MRRVSQTAVPPRPTLRANSRRGPSMVPEACVISGFGQVRGTRYRMVRVRLTVIALVGQSRAGRRE